MKHLLTGISALALTVSFPGVAFADFTLNILHINDFHSRFDPITATDSNCAEEADLAGECFGGIARLRAIIDERRADIGENSILLSAGDNFQGSIYYTTYKSKVVSDFFNQMGFDVVATGNHEFDDGPEEFLAFIEAAEFPIIGGNFDVSRDPLLSGKIKGSIVLEVGGERIGIIGATTEDTPEIASTGDFIEFHNVSQYVRGAAEALEAAGINKIILLSHIGYNVDLEVAAAVPGIDVIVGGHTHTLLSNVAENAAGPYPTFVTNPEGQEVVVVQANQYGKYLGELVVTWDDDGNVISAEGEPYLIDATVTGDEDFKAQLADLAGPIQEMSAQVIGFSTDAIEGSREVCRAMECSMGNLVADAMLDRVAAQGASIAIINGGGLRASIDAGDITMGEVLTVLPFSNTLATVELTGAGVIDALENGVSDVENGAGRFPQVAGLKYSFTLNEPAGSRISDVLVDEDGEWVPIDEEANYIIVTNDFMRRGGDGYGTFAEGANPYDFGPPLEQVLADYLANLGGEYTPYTDGRITKIE